LTHITSCVLYTASVFFSIHTNYSCLAVYQQRETYKPSDSRTYSSSPAAAENKITRSSPELQERQHSSYSSSFLEANAKNAQVLLARARAQQQLGSPTAAAREPKRKDEVSQEPKHLNVAWLFILPSPPPLQIKVLSANSG